MTDLQKANAELLKRQSGTVAPKHVGEVTTAVAQVSAYEHIPERKPERRGRVIKRATLKELDITNPLFSGAVEMVYRWRDRKQDGYTDASMVLCGPVGTGKTHIARAVLWSIAHTFEGEPIAPVGKFYTASDLLLKLSPTKTEWGGSEVPQPSTFIGGVPIIVIDDIGSEQVIPFIKPEAMVAETHARYFRVIDYCYQWRISLVITSNLSIHQLEQHLGARCWDRLCEMAPKGFMYDLTGVPSWRQKESGR